MDDKEIDELTELQGMLAGIAKLAKHEWNQQSKTSLSVTHLLILQLLNTKGPLRPSSLSGELQITTGGITGLVNKLVNEGYIIRNYDAADRRVILLEITEAGRQVLLSAVQYKEAVAAKLFGKLTAADVGDLRRICRKILP